MNVVFRDPELNGGCVFDAYLYVRTELPSGDPLVFRSPLHEDGGCIFADPSEIQVLRAGGGSKPDRWVDLDQEDEELLAVIMAATLRRGYGGIWRP